MEFTDSPTVKKESSAKIQGQTLLITFFDNKGTIHKKFVPVGQTINAAFYQAVLNRLLQRIWWVPPELHRTGQWIRLHDNTPAHGVRQFLARKMVPVLNHLPDSRDLATADFFLFPRLKAAIKGARLSDVKAIKDRLTAVLRSIPQKTFADCFRKLYECCQTCVVADGDYFERQEKKLYLLFCFLIGIAEVSIHIIIIIIIIIINGTTAQ